jgi:transporter family protein
MAEPGRKIAPVSVAFGNQVVVLQIAGTTTGFGMRSDGLGWQFWAVLSAVFAALTAIFAKLGVENVNSDLATFIRTIVVVCVLGVIVYATRQFQNPAELSGRTYLFLVLSGLGTGASWLCYFRALQLGNAAQVAPIDKLSVVLVAIFGTVFLGEGLTMANWLGVLLVAAGSILVAWR